MTPFLPGPVALGCMSLPLQDERLCMRIMESAIEAGIRLFDTADIYQGGRNEQVVGLFMKGRREQVELATKVGNVPRPDGSGWDWNPRKAYVMEAVERSLSRLGTDRIDLYQLHGGTVEDPMDETIDAFETLKRQGKVLRYGISSIRPNVVREYLARSSIDTLMCQYGVADRRPEESILPMIAQGGVRLLARGVLARGMLCGKNPTLYLGHKEAEMLRGAEAILACSSPARTPAQTAIRFVLQSHPRTTAVIGASTIAQIEEAAATLSSPPLTKVELDVIVSALPAKAYTEHR